MFYNINVMHVSVTYAARLLDGQSTRSTFVFIGFLDYSEAGQGRENIAKPATCHIDRGTEAPCLRIW